MVYYYLNIELKYIYKKNCDHMCKEQLQPLAHSTQLKQQRITFFTLLSRPIQRLILDYFTKSFEPHK